jgi:GNAT superfamily N-acetyltransferase
MLIIKELNDNLVDDYITILKERCKWLKERNIEKWDLRSLDIKSLLTRYDEPQIFGAFENDSCIGGFILLNKDERYWPNNEKDKAYYFHRFVVHPLFDGLGYSYRILNWLKHYGIEKGKDYIRINYQKHRTYLRKLYLKSGFIEVREIWQDDNSILVLGEYGLA